MRSAWRGLAVVVATVVLVASAPYARASAGGLCTELGASWADPHCVSVVTSIRKAEMLITLELPTAMLDDPVAGPPLSSYYRRVMEGWRKTGLETPRDSSASTYVEAYPGPGAVQSVIVHENYEPFGIQANNAYRSFVFDMAKGQRLQLADLFREGVDPLVVIPPAAAGVLGPVLDAARPPHAPGTYPFTVTEWQPGPDGLGYSGGYRSFGLSTDSLILYMPDAPMMRETPSPRDRLVWSMDGGTVIVHVPLTALAASLRPEYGGV